MQDNSPRDPSADPSTAILILIVTPEVISENERGAYTVLHDPELTGLTATSGPHSRFLNLCVPEENLLASPGTGASVVEQAFGISAALVGALSVGIMRAAFESALKFAKTDSRRGAVPLLQRQSVADLLIDIKMRADTSRLLTWKALHGLQHGPGDFKARLEQCLQAKIFSSDNAVWCVEDAMKAVGM